MSVSIILTGSEVALLTSSYQKELLEVQNSIDELLKKKSSIEERIKALGNTDTKGQQTFDIPITQPTSRVIHQSVFGGDNLLAYNTLNKKIYYTFLTTDGEFSTGETYSKLIEIFPKEAEKSKQNLVQSISKELGAGGKDGKTYIKTNNRDANGKFRFVLNRN